MPAVSVIIANYNGGPALEDAIRSALDQDLDDIEVIVVDDASTDDSLVRARRIAQGEPRLRVDALERNGGPGAARNRALELARGEWIAIFDGDDLMHPSRLRRLIGLGRRDGADIVADNLLLFWEDRPRAAETFLRGERAHSPTWLTPEAFALETRLYGPDPNLGFLKPVVRLDAWRRAGVRYDEYLPIGEDHDVLLRLLASGLRCRIDPEPGYFYRKHSASTSHRMAGCALTRMVEADTKFRRWAPRPSAALSAALDRRLASIATVQAFTAAVEALKARRFPEAASRILKRPNAALLFRMPIAAAAGRVLARLRRPPAPRDGRPRLVVISRQRLVGRTNGSSNYLLDLVQAARGAGLAAHLVQPTPKVLGRWPIVRLRPEMALFETIAIRGVLCLGPFIIATDPATYLAAARGVLAKVLGRLKLPSAWVGAQRAPYAPAAPWTTADSLFVARHARGAAVFLADYAWQTQAFPYALTPGARTAVVMHDLFHQRAAQFARQGAADSVATLTRDEEIALLGAAQAILAIQPEEACIVQALSPQSRVLLAPMTAHANPAAQPGHDGGLLFVGSNTAPNVLGLEWFFAQVWPAIRAAHPQAHLQVAGTVSHALGAAPNGVRYLGMVDDLAPLYAATDVVISPLTTGSGLKIKLIEALAQGKACVATTVTLQGVGPEAVAAVRHADTSADFAAAVNELLSDEGLRAELGERALRAIRAAYAPQIAHAEFQAWLQGQDRQVDQATPLAGAA